MDEPVDERCAGSRAGRAGRIATLAASVLIAAAAIGLFAASRLLEQGPSPAARAALHDSAGAFVSVGPRWVRFEPATGIRQPSVVLYPGANVAPEAYAPLAQRLAAAGHRVFIARMPFNLAVLDVGRADEIVFGRGSGGRYVIGGHSMGGAMAARYAARRPGGVDGVFFLGSYADRKGDLGRSRLRALQVTADRDRIMNEKAWTRGRRYLPAAAEYVTIAGGNHAQFGDYGPQAGDGTAAIAGEAQLRRVSEALVRWMEASR